MRFSHNKFPLIVFVLLIVPRANSCYAHVPYIAEFPQHLRFIDEGCGNPNNNSDSSGSKFLIPSLSLNRGNS